MQARDRIKQLHQSELKELFGIGAGSRFDYFLPEGPVGDILEPADDTPLWLRELCEGRPLQRD